MINDPASSLHWVFKDQHLLLLAQKCLLWTEERTLIVADVHLGKVGHFRKAGIAIPRSMEQEDLASLSDVLDRHPVDRIVFLGDLFHSELNNDWEWLLLWRGLFPQIEMVLVRGNHDILHDRHYEEAKFTVVEEWRAGPFLFTHAPATDDEGYVISGHVHPGVRLYGKGRQSVTLPCFYFGEKQGLLPAFGKFTGCVAVKPQEQDSVFGIVNHRVMPL